MASHLVSQHQLSSYATPINGAAGDATVVLGNDNTTVTGYNSHDSDGTIHVQDSTAAVFAATPAGTAGRKWMTQDSGGVYLYYDTGSAWVEVNYLRQASTGAVTITSASANALAVGRLGATTPAFNVDASTALQVAGLNVVGAVTGGTVAVVVTDSGSNANLTVNAKGSGTIGIGSVSTGRVTITPVVTLTGLVTTTAGFTGAVPFAGLATFNAGATIASGQTLTVTGATITGLTAASVAAGTFPAGAYVFASGGVTVTSGGLTVSSGTTAVQALTAAGTLTLNSTTNSTINSAWVFTNGNDTFFNTASTLGLHSNGFVYLTGGSGGIILAGSTARNTTVQISGSADTITLNVAAGAAISVASTRAVTFAAGISATTGAFSSTVSMTALTATTGAFSSDMSVATTKKVGLNVGLTSYLYESSASILNLIAASASGQFNVTFNATTALSADLGGVGADAVGLVVYDKDHGGAKRVSVGAADSGGTGFRMLRVVN